MAKKYQIRIFQEAFDNLDSIFAYIALEKLAPENAEEQVTRIKQAIRSLDTFPDSHQIRMTGDYSDGRYRQLLVDNYVVIFRIDEEKKMVYVITVQYQGRNI